MKKKLLLFVVTVLCFASTANASHGVGMYITYEYTGTGTGYIFRLKLYRDCSGLSAPMTMAVDFTSACAPGFSVNLPLVSFSQIPFNPCAGSGTTTCQGGSIYGFEEYNYEGFVSVPPCYNWNASASICCRSSGVTNVIDPDFYETYVETNFDNLNYAGNSSPAFNSVPVNYYCVGIPSFKDYSAYDIDGDSLHYELVAAQCNPGVSVPYAPPYTSYQPLATLTPTSLDPLNGILMFNPSMIQVSVVGIMVSEYRNGVLIGLIRVDDEIVVASGIANPDTVTGRIYIDNNSNGIFDIGDMGMPNLNVQMAPGNLFTTTDGNGKYEFFTIDGIWDITVPNPSQYTSTNPASINVNTNGITFSSNNDFILEIDSNMNDLEIYLNPAHNPIPGQDYPVQLSYENSGTTIQTNVDITLVLDPLLQFVSSTLPPTTVNGNTITWVIPMVHPFNSYDIDIITTVDTTATIGAPVYLTVTISPVINDLHPNNNSDIIQDFVATSCDPNYKEVSPSGDVDLAFIAAQDWLTYRIYFQNLGTAPAQIVRISDFLDLDLEIATLELITSSFPCAMSLTSPNQLEFTFYGINLPAASVDEPGSHGFVEYRIRPKATLLPGMYITNSAGIYFDFNAPVYTNLVHNKVVTSVGVAENTVNEDQISVYPNPASDHFILEINSTDSRVVEIEIYNLMGELVKKLEQKLSSGINRVTVPVMELSSGEYFIAVTGNEGKCVSKLSVVRD